MPDLANFWPEVPGKSLVRRFDNAGLTADKFPWLEREPRAQDEEDLGHLLETRGVVMSRALFGGPGNKGQEEEQE